MTLREWGLGLEALTECYFKYVKGCIVERGRAYQEARMIKHPRGRFNVPYPAEVDIIAVAPGLRKIMLVSCKEEVDNLKMAEGICNQFESQTKWVAKTFQTGNGKNMAKWVACVRAAETAQKQLKKRGIGVITAKEMIKALSTWLEKSYPKRKGVHREPLLWLLQTMKN